MSASLSDILTAAKNAVVAINGAVVTYLGVRGTQGAYGLTTATVVTKGPGRVGSIAVITGAAGGLVYDAGALGVTGSPICAIPATAGVYVIDMPFSNGLLVVPGAGSSVTISFATGGSVGYANSGGQ